MNRILIWGIGETGKRYYKQVKDIKEVVGFLDNDSKTWGGGI